MSSLEPLLTLQQKTLAAIDAEVTRLLAYCNACPVGAAADVIGQWFTGLDDFAWRLEQLTPSAVWLVQQGFPAAGQRLETVSRDLARARQTYLEMYQSVVAVQSRLSAIWAGVDSFSIATISHVTQYRQTVFARWLQGYFDVNEERCFDCHRLIGIPGGGYCLDCARRRGLVS
ncbi:MAG TPA: hypothetical protein VN999_16150 [Thermoanaerobaculia bacterium]|nr:hypothetical protein [Thermoanaerobaculia bacterium]